MIKYLLLFLLPVQVFAVGPGCHLLLLKGTVRPIPKSSYYELQVNERTQSERVFKFKENQITRIAPYIKLGIQGEFIFKEKDPQTGSTIEEIKSSDYSVPDPLNGRGMKYSGPIKCP